MSGVVEMRLNARLTDEQLATAIAAVDYDTYIPGLQVETRAQLQARVRDHLLARGTDSLLQVMPAAEHWDAARRAFGVTVPAWARQQLAGALADRRVIDAAFVGTATTP